MNRKTLPLDQRNISITHMKLAPISAILLLLAPCVSAQEQEYIKDAPLGYLHIRTKRSPSWIEDHYYRCDKVTSVTLVKLNADKEPKCQVRITTGEMARSGSEKGGPVVVTLPMQPKEEAETLMFQIMQWIDRKQ
jgi:hypothetical protein